MGLDRYEALASLMADELLDLLTPDEQDQFADELDLLLREPSRIASLRPQLEPALDFLSAAPEVRRAHWQRTPVQERFQLWFQARYLALQSASALRQAQEISGVIRDAIGDRQAIARVALSIDPDDLSPSLTTLLDRAS